MNNDGTQISFTPITKYIQSNLNTKCVTWGHIHIESICIMYVTLCCSCAAVLCSNQDSHQKALTGHYVVI